MRRLVEPPTVDHMHWYRVIGAVRLREQVYESAQAPPGPAVQSSGEACPPSPETALTEAQVYERWLNSQP
jgi:hypothetical protein